MLRYIAIFLLLFNGIGALYGGGLLIMDPTGRLLKLPFEYISNTVFGNYLLPGIVLFLFLGVGSIVLAALTFFRKYNYGRLMMYLGLIIVVWLSVQLITIRITYFLQYIIGAVALLLVLIGYRLQKNIVNKEIIRE